ncbi:MAG: FHA domain-containing protein, partial [Gammaproteobacteria bacterium]
MAAEQTEFATEPTPVFEETASTQGDHSTLAGGSTARTSTGAVDIDPAGGQSVSTPSPNSVAPNTPTTSSADGGRDDAGSDVFFLSDDLFTNRSSSSASASTSNASERSSGLVDDDDEYEESDDPFTAAMLSALEPEQSQPAILQNLDTGEQIALHNLPFTIGSAPSNNLVVTGKQVAAKQAQIENQFQRYVIQDLTRHNNAKRNETDHPEMGGVKVNGYRVENVPLEEGDEVSIGENTFVFHPGVLVARETPDEAET